MYKFLLFSMLITMSLGLFAALKDMSFVEGGDYIMGVNIAELMSDSIPPHKVTISSFYAARFETTQKEWTSIMGYNNSSAKGDSLPVTHISYFAILVYCNKLSLKEGLKPCYKIKSSTNPTDWGSTPTDIDPLWDEVVCDWTANGYRLPTEAEWEYAHRGGKLSTNTLYSGSNDPHETCWFFENAKVTQYRRGTKPVGTKKPNELGLYDMGGNVAEICWDRWAPLTKDIAVDPKGAASSAYIVARGGSFYGAASACTPSNRVTVEPFKDSNSDIGFRVFRTKK